MSQEAIEEIRRQLEAFNLTSRSSTEERRRALQRAVSGLDPEVEWHQAPDLPDSHVLHGRDAVAAATQEWIDSIEEFRVEPQEFIDRGDYVVVPLLLCGRLRGSPESDQEIALPHTHVYKVLEDKIVEVHEYLTLEQALEAVGPSE